ncbi:MULTISPECIES: hypothetical protein [Actinosynnema]|uniref:hypothetical protein n=1 Tax=Actinosynnema TaxID=40566 RepID=UPI0020A3567E|nr:hypothetical protein [Actinosynnema pretiosum]MCP2097406.1 hypothetical protein [Actinosynnema pretiosum]
MSVPALDRVPEPAGALSLLPHPHLTLPGLAALLGTDNAHAGPQVRSWVRQGVLAVDQTGTRHLPERWLRHPLPLLDGEPPLVRYRLATRSPDDRDARRAHGLLARHGDRHERALRRLVLLLHDQALHVAPMLERPDRLFLPRPTPPAPVERRIAHLWMCLHWRELLSAQQIAAALGLHEQVWRLGALLSATLTRLGLHAQQARAQQLAEQAAIRLGAPYAPVAAARTVIALAHQARHGPTVWAQILPAVLRRARCAVERASEDDVRALAHEAAARAHLAAGNPSEHAVPARAHYHQALELLHDRPVPASASCRTGLARTHLADRTRTAAARWARGAFELAEPAWGYEEDAGRAARTLAAAGLGPGSAGPPYVELVAAAIRLDPYVHDRELNAVLAHLAAPAEIPAPRAPRRLLDDGGARPTRLPAGAALPGRGRA